MEETSILRGHGRQRNTKEQMEMWGVDLQRDVPVCSKFKPRLEEDTTNH
jgi:hypothetical protein